MKKQGDAHVRELFKRQFEDLAAQIGRNGGGIRSEQLELLAGLGKVIEIHESVGVRLNRWLTFAMCSVGLLVFSLLQFTNVSTTEIEGDIVATGLSFTTSKTEVLSARATLSELEIAGIQDIQIPSPESHPKGAIEPQRYPATNVRLAPTVAGKGRGELTLDRLELPEKSQVTLDCTDITDQYRLDIQAENFGVQAAAIGSLTIRGPGLPFRTLEYRSAKLIAMSGGAEGVKLYLSFPGVDHIFIHQQLGVSKIAFTRTERYLTSLKDLSTIRSGNVRLEDLDDKLYQLRSGEVVTFEGFRGEIRSLRFAGNLIELGFYGSVTGMTAGGNHRSIMPTLLEWSKAQHGFLSLWAAAIYCLGLAVVVLKWLGFRT